MSEQKIKIENGAVIIGETDNHIMFLARTDLQKHGFAILDIPKYGYDSRMALAIKLMECMVSTTGTPPEDPTKLVNRAFEISELSFAKGLELGWMHSLDEEAMRILREAKELGGFDGIVPGRD